MIDRELRGLPLGLHTNGQTPKVKGFQSAYMAALFGTFGAKSLAFQEEFECIRKETQTLVERSNFFSIKYSESNKRTLTIYFNELLFSLLERSSGFGLLVPLAKCEEALINSCSLHTSLGCPSSLSTSIAPLLHQSIAIHREQY